MPNRPATITQAEIARSVRAAQALGREVAGYEVDHSAGKVRVFFQSDMLAPSAGPNPDELLK